MTNNNFKYIARHTCCKNRLRNMTEKKVLKNLFYNYVKYEIFCTGDYDPDEKIKLLYKMFSKKKLRKAFDADVEAIRKLKKSGKINKKIPKTKICRMTRVKKNYLVKYYCKQNYFVKRRREKRKLLKLLKLKKTLMLMKKLGLSSEN